MKKIIFTLCCFVFFISSYHAENKFYLGEKITNMFYIMNKNGTKVFANFKKIHKTDTNELVYCVEPGVKLSSDDYEPFEMYNEKFYIDQDKMDRVKLVAKYGYLYGNHTDIKWYAITQYLIWKIVMPTTWDLYFVDSNKNPLYNAYQEEINEINNLINNHHNKPDIKTYYEFNYKDPIVIEDKYNLIVNYNVSSGFINSNKYYNNEILNPGNYSLDFTISGYQLPLFYNHPTGQDIYVKGEIYEKNINTLIHVTAGKISISECDEKTYRKDIIGGVYEILNQDDEVEETIDCKENNEYCLSNYLPVGFYKIRVKELPEEYEINDHIYDVWVKDEETTEIDVCSLKINKSRQIEKEEPEIEPLIESDNEEVENEPDNDIEEEYSYKVPIIENSDELVIPIPSTSKNSYIRPAIIFIIILSTLLNYVIRHKKKSHA